MAIDLNDPEVKAAIEAAVAEQMTSLTASQEEVLSKLKANNALLTKQLKEARKTSDIDPAEHAKLEETVAQLTEKLEQATKEGSTKVAALTKDLEKAVKAAQAESAFNTKLLRDNGLTDALVKANVAPQYLKPLKAMFAEQVQIVAEGENRAAKVGEKALADFIAEWAQTDEGKFYVKAPDNSGGGSSGNHGGAGGAKVISFTDTTAFGANLADIAAGKVKVEVPPS